MARLSICLAALALVGCGGRLGNGHVITQERQVGAFTAVENDTSLRVNVQEASETSVQVTVDENLQELVVTRVVDDRLVIEVENREGGISPSPGVHVDIRTPRFLSAQSVGSGRVVVTGVSGSDDLTLEGNGSGGLEFSGTANQIDLLSTGSGSVKLTGSAQMLLVTVTGSGSTDARDLHAQSADLETTGSGSISATLGGGTVRLTVHGSGSIDWWGDASVVEMVDDGSGSITHR